jgi:hypothetical protein
VIESSEKRISFQNDKQVTYHLVNVYSILLSKRKKENLKTLVDPIRIYNDKKEEYIYS